MRVCFRFLVYFSVRLEAEMAIQLQRCLDDNKRRLERALVGFTGDPLTPSVPFVQYGPGIGFQHSYDLRIVGYTYY